MKLESLVSKFREAKGSSPEIESQIITEAVASSKQRISLIELLEPELTSVVDDERRAALQLFSSVIVNVPSELYTSNEAVVLVQYFMSKLKDTVAVPHAIKALKVLVKVQDLSSDLLPAIAERIFEDVSTQSNSRAIRSNIFELLQWLCDNVGNSLREYFGDELAKHLVQQIDGERDPRCLIQTFQLATVVAKLLPLERHADELFDVTACYFPITFDPPPGDKIGITREQLINSLQDSLSASVKFAKPCMSMLLDKVTSSNDNIKIQTYSLISTCAQRFGAQALSESLSKIYIAVRTELFQSFDERIKKVALQCLTSVCTALSTPCDPASFSISYLESFLAPIVTEGIRCLGDFDVGLINLHARIIEAAACSSRYACIYLLQNFGSAVLERLELEESDDAHQTAYLETLDKILTDFGSEDDSSSPAQIYVARIIHIVFKALDQKSDEVLIAGLNVLQKLINNVELTTEIMSKAITICVDLVLHGKAGVLCRKGADTVAHLGKAAPQLVEELVLSRYMLAFSNSDSNSQSSRKVIANTDDMVYALAVIVQSRDSLAGTVLPGLADALKQAHDNETAYIFASGIGAVAMASLHDSKFMIQVLDTILNLTKDMENNAKLMNTKVFSQLLSVVARCTRQLQESEQVVFYEQAENIIRHSNDSFAVCANSVVICQLAPSIFGSNEVLELMSALQHLALCNDQVDVRTEASRALSAVINKLPAAINPASALEQLFPSLECDEIPQEARAIGVLGWVAKGLIIRGEKRGFDIAAQFIQSLFKETLDDKSVKAVVSAFTTIMQEDDIALCQESGSIIRIMQRQRLFAQSLPALLAGYRNAGDSELGAPCLHVLCVMLQQVPKPVLLAEIGQVLPVIMESLAIPKAGVAEASLSVVQTMLSEVPDRLDPVLEGLVLLLLNLSRNGSLKERQLSLENLTALSDLPTHRIFPLANKVINGMSALDDHKRIVRSAAAQCSSRWHLISEPS